VVLAVLKQASQLIKFTQTKAGSRAINQGIKLNLSVHDLHAEFMQKLVQMSH